MPTLDVSELNVVLAVLGTFIVAYGIISVKIKSEWYLGEALPAVVIGIILGPIAAKFIDASKFGGGFKGQQDDITLGMSRVVIGVQLVMAGFQLPAKYLQKKLWPMFVILIPIMTIMWLFTTGCMLLTVPNLTLLSAMVIGSCVTSTDPILSQAIAKGPFADKYVRRPLRELISAEAGANDGFGFPFLMLAVYLIRHADSPLLSDVAGVAGRSEASIYARSGEDIGRLGGGPGKALVMWITETWLYFVALSMVYGAVVGFASCKAVKFALRKKWINTESYLLYPTGLGLFLVGSCGAIGIDDLLACFVAGCFLNWDGQYLAETEALHDEVNSSIDVLLNFGGFMYIGAIIPFSEFHQPETTGITLPRLFSLGILILIFRRIPAILMMYKTIPGCVQDWKEALFMGYFGPIGIGAVFYVEHTKHLLPKAEEVSNDQEIVSLMTLMVPVVYWLVLFSIVVHGLSIPALNAIYKYVGIKAVEEDMPVEVAILSSNAALPKNSKLNPNRKSILVTNRFSKSYPIVPYGNQTDISNTRELTRWNTGFQSPKWGRENKDSLEIIGGLKSDLPKEFV